MLLHKVIILGLHIILADSFTADTNVFNVLSQYRHKLSQKPLNIDAHIGHASLTGHSASSVGQSACLTKLESLVANIQSKDPVKVTESLAFLDDGGKPGPGLLFRGNANMMGNYDSCMSMKNSTRGYYNYCVVSAPALLYYTYPLTFTWSGCLPLECQHGNNTDVITFLEKYIQSILIIDANRTTVLCPEDTTTRETGTYFGLVYIYTIVALAGIGTMWCLVIPIYNSLRNTGPQDTQHLVTNEVIDADAIRVNEADQDASPHPPAPTKTSKVTDYLGCFSLPRSLAALTNTDTKPGMILCLNGIRVCSINWVVLAHVYAFLSSFAIDTTILLDIAKRRSFTFVLNGFTSVDSFFVLSGFLVTYLLLKQLARKGNLSPVQWAVFYLHRYLRLTLPLLVAVFVEGWLLTDWVRGPYSYVFPTTFSVGCKDYWWAALLYINNLVPQKADKVCVGQSWYLSNDMQFFVLAPLLVYLLWKRPRIGLLTGGLLATCSVVAAGVITYHYKLAPTDIDPDADNFWLLYNKPWIRCVPYIVGIVGGWVYWKYGKSMEHSVTRLPQWKKAVIAVPLWICTCSIQYGVVWGLHDDLTAYLTKQKKASMADSVSYESLGRLAWGLTLTIQIIVCQVGLGGFINSILSWKGWIVLGRLTYSVYLLHIHVIYIVFLCARHQFSLAPDFEMAVFYLGILMMSYLFAALIYLGVEQPYAAFEKLTIRKNK